MADNGVWPSRDDLLILSDLDRRRRERVLFEHEENNVVTRSDQNIPDDHNRNWSERPSKAMIERRHHKQSDKPDMGVAAPRGPQSARSHQAFAGARGHPDRIAVPAVDR